MSVISNGDAIKIEELSHENKKLRESEARYRELVEKSLGLICTHDIDGVILSLNSAAAQSLEQTEEELLGKNLSSILAPKVKIYFDDYLKALREKGVSEGVMQVVTKYGNTRFWKYKNILTNVNGDRPFVIGFSQDITEHVLLEKELKKARLEAEEAGKAKEQFLANVSHEIRTPMNSIIGFSQLLLSTSLSTKQKKYVESIASSSKTLLVIINDVLDMSKINSGKMTFEENPFRITDVVYSVVCLLEHQAEAKGITLKAIVDDQVPDTIIGDSIRLNQILLNLTGNALKFTRKGKVSIHVSLQKQEMDEVWISFMIKDTGIGISGDKLSSVFESFTQASNSTTRKYGGTGLGLSITKQLVELQGGSISVESTLNKGSEFKVVLKYKKSKSKLSKKIPRKVEIKKIKNECSVLLVEDNTANQFFAKTILSEYGYHVDVVSNGKQAVQRIKNQLYDIVLMDVQMPVMDGYEATFYIRTKLKSALRSIPIIGLTAHASNLEFEKCKKAGMNDCISKPFDPEKLNEVIQGNLRSKANMENRAIDTFKHINLSYLKKSSLGKADFIIEVLGIFMREMPKSVRLIKSQSKKRELDKLKATIHKVKSNFAALGAKKALQYITKIEANFSTEINLLKLDEYVSKLVNEIEKVLSELEVAYQQLK